MPTRSDAPALVEVQDLVVTYPRRRGGGGAVRAVDGVSFDVAQQETVGLVGESGSGKSTIARAILGLVKPESGAIRLRDADITHATWRQRREMSRYLQVVFQDPYSSLNPARTIGQTLAEPLGVHEHLSAGETKARVAEALERVGLDARAAARYPVEFSGGQRQRIAIARAFVVSPQMIICDEPVSSLDLSIQAQILNLFHDLQQELSVSYLFIAHDLFAVQHVSHRILVLYHGRVMESGPAEVVFSQPRHPYTRELLAATPIADPKIQRARRAKPKPAGVAIAAHDGDGCPFLGRCPYAVAACTERQALRLTSVGTYAACHRNAELPAWTEAESLAS